MNAGAEALQQRRQKCDQMFAVLGAALRLHAPDQILERRDGGGPCVAVVAVFQVDVLERSVPVLAQERREKMRHRITFDSALDLCATHHRRDLQTIAVVDVIGRQRDVRFGGLLLLGEKFLEIFPELVEERKVLREVVKNPANDALDLAIERIVAAHVGRPAEAGVGERVDEQSRRMSFLREERAVEHRRFEHRNLQARQLRLDAVGQIARLEDEVEQHRDHLDRHRLELVRLAAERGFLQVAQDVVHALRDARECDLRAADVEVGLAGLQARQSFVQIDARDDRRPRNVARRRRRERHEARARRAAESAAGKIARANATAAATTRAVLAHSGQ